MGIRAIFGVLGAIFCGSAAADDATIAVAANFARPMERLEADFESRTGHDLAVVTGSTGQLYAQIIHGAPFDVFLSADVERVDALEQGGRIVEGRRFTYAVGQLVLWSRNDSPGSGGEAAGRIADLLSSSDGRLAIANPELAPYGRAALQVLEHLDLRDGLADRLVYGESVSQALAFGRTGAAQSALVSRGLLDTQVHGLANRNWALSVPDAWHDPIRQDAALLRRGEDNPAARAFFAYLRSEEARAVIAASGYRTD